MDDFIKKCKDAGLKVTHQRLTIYKKVRAMNNHPSVERLFESLKPELPTISYDTVHRTLMTFNNLGLLDIVEGQGGPRRFDPNLRPHHHLHCVKCDKIIDFYDRSYDALELPEDLEKRFTILGKRVIIDIICTDCL